MLIKELLWVPFLVTLSLKRYWNIDIITSNLKYVIFYKVVKMNIRKIKMEDANSYL